MEADEQPMIYQIVDQSGDSLSNAVANDVIFDNSQNDNDIIIVIESQPEESSEANKNIENLPKKSSTKPTALPRKTAVCAISGCAAKMLPFFSFPKDVKTRKSWLDSTNRTDVNPTNAKYVLLI
jgi:hypothetical protein